MQLHLPMHSLPTESFANWIKTVKFQHFPSSGFPLHHYSCCCNYAYLSVRNCSILLQMSLSQTCVSYSLASCLTISCWNIIRKSHLLLSTLHKICLAKRLFLHTAALFSPQDSVFRLEPHIENGRGKSPYDPRLTTSSMLIGECQRLLDCAEGHIKTWESWRHPPPCSFILANMKGVKYMLITEQGIPHIHYKRICSEACIYNLVTRHWHHCKSLFQSECTKRRVCRTDET